LLAHDNSHAAPAPKLIAEFNAALADDLDTPRAIRALRAALRQRDAAAVRWMLDILVGTASLT
jgi:cysteinyl-tRNA synthetase